MWHHAASSNSTSDEACVNYQVRGNPDNPVGNMTLGRTGDLWPIAGGASNCSGKGGPMTFSRGTCAKDSGNTALVNVEVNNNGVGGPWAVELVDAYFTLSNAINAYLGNLPTDITTHALGAGDGYTDRKVDCATAAAVEGPWRPRSVNSSGTWSLVDMRAECAARAGQLPGPQPPNGDDDDVEKICVRDVDGYPWVTDFASYAWPITEEQAGRGRDLRGWSVGPDTGPWPIDEQDSDLMKRLSGKS
jgi:hypothetical protein